MNSLHQATNRRNPLYCLKQEQTNDNFRIDRGPTVVLTVLICHRFVDERQVQNVIDFAQVMILGNEFLQ